MKFDDLGRAVFAKISNKFSLRTAGQESSDDLRSDNVLANFCSADWRENTMQVLRIFQEQRRRFANEKFAGYYIGGLFIFLEITCQLPENLYNGHV